MFSNENRLNKRIYNFKYFVIKIFAKNIIETMCNYVKNKLVKC